MSKENPVKEFCQNHHIRVLDTNKRACRIRKVNHAYFTDPSDYNRVEEHLNFDTEPLYTVEISKSELERIAEFEDQVFNHMKRYGHYDMFTILMEQKEEEKQLKEKYPAVQKAYEHYSLMLQLAKAGEL
jgi:hypothetical protein